MLLSPYFKWRINRVEYIGTVVTDVGICRKSNQDSVCLKIAKVKDLGYVSMVIICDGMGGFEKGELASAEIVRFFSKWFEEELQEFLPDYTWKKIKKSWEKNLIILNDRLLTYAKRQNIRLGTTFSGILCINDEYMIFHIGDTRIYGIDHTVNQLTEDHTLVEQKIKEGVLKREEEETAKFKNVLTQCIGCSEKIKPQIIFGKITQSITFMICSDGFRHVIKSDEMYEWFQPEKLQDIVVMHDSCEQLVELAKQRKEKDNITVALLKCTV